MPAPPCCIQREAGEAFVLFLAVFALKPTALFPRNREEPKLFVFERLVHGAGAVALQVEGDVGIAGGLDNLDHLFT